MFVKKLYEKKNFIENTNDEIVERQFKDNQSFYLMNCHDTEFYVNGNVTNIALENCHDCTFYIYNIIAKLELLRCSNVVIKVLKNSATPITVQFDITHSVFLDISHPCDIQTISCMDICINGKELQCSMFNDVKQFQLVRDQYHFANTM